MGGWALRFAQDTYDATISIAALEMGVSWRACESGMADSLQGEILKSPSAF